MVCRYLRDIFDFLLFFQLDISDTTDKEGHVQLKYTPLIFNNDSARIADYIHSHLVGRVCASDLHAYFFAKKPCTESIFSLISRKKNGILTTHSNRMQNRHRSHSDHSRTDLTQVEVSSMYNCQLIVQLVYSLHFVTRIPISRTLPSSCTIGPSPLRQFTDAFCPSYLIESDGAFLFTKDLSPQNQQLLTDFARHVINTSDVLLHLAPSLSPSP